MTAYEPAAVCIYCQESKPLTDFNREHVMLQAFGKFSNQSFVLRCVCTACNSHFGNTLDRVLGRESIEGRQRFETGLLKPDRDRRFGRGNRLRLTLRGTPYDGAILEEIPHEQGLPEMVVTIAPQVGIGPDEKGPFTWFRLAEFPSKEQLKAQGFGPKYYLQIWGCTDEEGMAAIERAGFTKPVAPPSREEGVFAEPYSTTAINVQGHVDDVLMRAIAKLSFNYLAFHSEPVARMEQFRRVRNYIRYGDASMGKVVTLAQAPILEGVPGNRQLLAHVLAVSWDAQTKCVVGQVSLLGWCHYRVELGDGFLVAPEDVESGHAFDPYRGRITALIASSRRAGCVVWRIRR